MGKKFRGKDVPERGSRFGGKERTRDDKKVKPKLRSSGGVKAAEREEEPEEAVHAPARKVNRKTGPLELQPEPDAELGMGDTAAMNVLEEEPIIDDQNEGAIGGDVGPVHGAPAHVAPGSSGQVGAVGDNLSLEFEQPSSTTRRLTCTKCHADFEVDMSQVGKEIICPTCNNRFLLTSKDIQKQVELLTAQVHSLRVQLEQSTSQINHYQTLSQTNRTKLEQAVAAGREVDAERERLAIELEKVQRQGLGGRAGPAVDEMRARLDTVDAQRKSLEVEVRDLRGKLQKQENRSSQLENDNQNLNIELQLLRTKVANLESAKGGASSEDLDAARAELAQAKSGAADLKHRIEDLQQEVAQAKSAKEGLSKAIHTNEDLKRKLSDVEQQLARAKATPAAPAGPSREQLQELRDRIVELEEVANQRRDEIRNLKDQLARQERDAAQGSKVGDEVRDLLAKLGERDRTVSEMNQKLHVKSEALENSARDLQEKSRVLGERDARLQELHGNLSRREGDLRDLQHQLSDKDRQIADKMRHLGTLQQKVQDMERALEDAGRNKGSVSDDQHKHLQELKGQLTDALHQAAQADRTHVQEVLKYSHELRDSLKRVGALEGEIAALHGRLASASANSAANASAGANAAAEALKARVAELTVALDRERATVLDLKRRLTNGSDRNWAPVTTHLTHNFGVFRVGGEKDNHEYIDVLFPRGTELPRPGELLTVKRAAYKPKHNIGNMQYLLASEVVGDQPAGDINKMHKLVFPFDKTIDPSGRYGVGDTKILTKASDYEIVESYFCNHEGIVTCEFERQADGKIMRWTFSLVTLKSTN